MRGRKGPGRSSPVRCRRVIASRQFDYDASSAESWCCSPWLDRLSPACRTRDAAVSHPADTIAVGLPPPGNSPPSRAGRGWCTCPPRAAPRGGTRTTGPSARSDRPVRARRRRTAQPGIGPAEPSVSAARAARTTRGCGPGCASSLSPGAMLASGDAPGAGRHHRARQHLRIHHADQATRPRRQDPAAGVTAHRPPHQREQTHVLRTTSAPRTMSAEMRIVTQPVLAARARPVRPPTAPRTAWRASLPAAPSGTDGRARLRG